MSKIKGYVHLSRWTPKIAAKAARARCDKIELLLQEIADLYGDVYQPVVSDCDALKAELAAVRESIDEAEEARVEL